MSEKNMLIERLKLNVSRVGFKRFWWTALLTKKNRVNLCCMNMNQYKLKALLMDVQVEDVISFLKNNTKKIRGIVLVANMFSLF